MQQGLLKEHQGPGVWGWRDGGASQSRDSLCWADGHSHHLWVLSLGHWDLAAIEGPPSLLATVPQLTAAPPHASLRVCIQPDIGSTRWLVRMLLYFAFKANPHTSTHTATWPKFEKPFLQYHSCYLIIYHSAQRQQISSGMRDRNSSRNADHSASQMSPWTTEPIRTCDRENNRIR